MADQEHVAILKQGVEVWNQWRYHYPEIHPDLSYVHLAEVDLRKVDFSKVNLSWGYLLNVDLSEANLVAADLFRATLIAANLYKANLSTATLFLADLRDTNFSEANFFMANLAGADLRGANLQSAELNSTILNQANLKDAKLNNSFIYGVSAWNVNLEDTEQLNLVIMRDGEVPVTVDNIKLAQFVYLMLDNQEVGSIIDTIAKKMVLVLGRFTPERKVVLDALREKLRNHDLLPVVFDFEGPRSRNLTETVSTLAHMSHFIIADLTDAKSVPQELERIVPRLRVPVQSLLHVSEKEAYAMYRDFEDYKWVLPIFCYQDIPHLLGSMNESIIMPAKEKAKELEKRA